MSDWQIFQKKSAFSYIRADATMLHTALPGTCLDQERPQGRSQWRAANLNRMNTKWFWPKFESDEYNSFDRKSPATYLALDAELTPLDLPSWWESETSNLSKYRWESEISNLKKSWWESEISNLSNTLSVWQIISSTFILQFGSLRCYIGWKIDYQERTWSYTRFSPNENVGTKSTPNLEV